MGTRKKNKKLQSILIIILCLVVVFAGLGWLYHVKHKTSSEEDTEAHTTSDVPSAQSNFTGANDNKNANSTTNNDSATGGIVDNNGASSTSVDTSNPTSSSNGDIVVYSPQKNSLLKSGATISGTSKLQKVSYRINDTNVGEISTGTLNVVNGKFSGTIQFQTSAANGQLDFFGTQSDGNEFDNISIPVQFK